MERRSRQINTRFTEDEYQLVLRRAEERKQKLSEFLRDLLRFGMLPESVSRQ